MLIRTSLTAIARKQAMDIWREGLAASVVALGMAMWFEWIVLRRLLPMLRSVAVGVDQPQFMPQFLSSAPTLSLAYLPLIIIPIFGHAILTRCHVRDVLSGSLALTISTGLNLGLLWGIQIATVFVGGYLLTVAAWILGAVMVAAHPGIGLALTAPNLVAILALSPLSALGVLSILGFCLWTIRFGRVLVSMLPTTLSMVIMVGVATHPVTPFLMGLSVIALMGSLAVTALCGLGISRIRRGFIIGL